jgi:hypothetical protein
MHRVEIPYGRRYVTLHDDPMRHFLSMYDEDTSRPRVALRIKKFQDWLNQQEGWAGVGLKQLLIRQLTADDPYEIPELIQSYANSLTDRRRNTIRGRVSVVLQFLRKNRCPLPEDVTGRWFKIRSTVPAVQYRLTAEIIRNVITRLPILWRSLYLVKYQSMLDTKRLWWVNVNCADQITRQLRNGQKIIRIDVLCSRKKNGVRRRVEMYFTYFGHDAAADLIRYFNEIRGWPKQGEPVWVYTREDIRSGGSPHSKRRAGSAIDRNRIGHKWVQSLRSSGYIPRKPDPIPCPAMTRYGYDLDAFRDVAISELYTHAKDQDLDMDCVRFWSGLLGEVKASHLAYDKFYQDSEYMEGQYALAEPYLNILSGTPAVGQTQSSIDERPRNCQMTYTISASTTFENSAFD